MKKYTNYTDSYLHLNNIVNYNEDCIIVDETITVRNFSFESQNAHLLPCGVSLKNTSFPNDVDSCSEEETTKMNRLLGNNADADINENKHFRYHLFMPSGLQKVSEVVLVLHGFNEKSWDKYLPWARRITEATGKAVLLFPIAFHMNRAPLLWSSMRDMFQLCSLRKELFSDMECSSLFNVAISTRVHFFPQRFIWSGMQTYYDIIQLVEQIKKGEHPAIDKEATIDFCSYSIGAFLSQIVMMTNYNNYFGQSKLALFCGGAVFNRLSSVSKFILDSEANLKLSSFMLEQLEAYIEKDANMRHYLKGNLKEGLYFMSMLNNQKMQKERDEAFCRMRDRMLAVVLKQDKVVSSEGVISTLLGEEGKNPIRIELLDFPYEYTHETPFPPSSKIPQQVDASFDEAFKIICDFLLDTRRDTIA